MNQEILEKYEPLVIEIAAMYLDNMALELGKKYKNKNYELNPTLSPTQANELKQKHNVSSRAFAELYEAFQNMQPTVHLQKALGAFTASGGNIDIVPSFDETTQKLHIAINYMIKDRMFEKIEGLSELENVFLRMNAMLQIEAVLANAESDAPPF